MQLRSSVSTSCRQLMSSSTGYCFKRLAGMDAHKYDTKVSRNCTFRRSKSGALLSAMQKPFSVQASLLPCTFRAGLSSSFAVSMVSSSASSDSRQLTIRAPADIESLLRGNMAALAFSSFRVARSAARLAFSAALAAFSSAAAARLLAASSSLQASSSFTSPAFCRMRSNLASASLCLVASSCAFLASSAAARASEAASFSADVLSMPSSIASKRSCADKSESSMALDLSDAPRSVACIFESTSLALCGFGAEASSISASMASPSAVGLAANVSGAAFTTRAALSSESESNVAKRSTPPCSSVTASVGRKLAWAVENCSHNVSNLLRAALKSMPSASFGASSTWMLGSTLTASVGCGCCGTRSSGAGVCWLSFNVSLAVRSASCGGGGGGTGGASRRGRLGRSHVD
mmetsp:Transcript_43970/g.84417  ORF Transcript_43970/g.84417 Transcript_43970/m.84417 type:complete len:406 (-) Transcript_43970:593-1810(-)